MSELTRDAKYGWHSHLCESWWIVKSTRQSCQILRCCHQLGSNQWDLRFPSFLPTGCPVLTAWPIIKSEMPWQQRQRFLRSRHIAQENRRTLTKTRLSLSPARWQVGHGLHQLGGMLRLRPLLERTKIGQMCASGKVSQVESSFCLSLRLPLIPGMHPNTCIDSLFCRGTGGPCWAHRWPAWVGLCWKVELVADSNGFHTWHASWPEIWLLSFWKPYPYYYFGNPLSSMLSDDKVAA